MLPVGIAASTVLFGYHEFRTWLNVSFKVDTSKYIQQQIDIEKRQLKTVREIKQLKIDPKEIKSLEECEKHLNERQLIQVAGGTFVNIGDAQIYLDKLNTNIKTRQRWSATYQISNLFKTPQKN
jgi:hypothetical protein